MLEQIFHFIDHREWLVATLLVLVMMAFLWRAKPEERGRLRNTVVLFLLSEVGLVVAGGARLLGLENMAPTLREMVTLTAGIAFIRLSGRFLFGYLLPLAKLRSTRILEDLLVILGYVVLILFSLRHLGLDIGHLVAGSAVLTAVMGFAMQDTLGNLLGGIVLELDDSFNVGDWIKVDDLVGRVICIEWRAVTIETRNWEQVVIPNAALMKSKFIVLGKRQGNPDYWRRWVWFNVDIEHPPIQVIQEVEKALRRATIANMAKIPPPNCILMSFESGSARYAVRYWLSDLQQDDPTDSAVRITLHAALQRAGIELALSEYALRMQVDNEKRIQAEQGKRVAQREGVLREVEFFRTLSPEELRMVAERLTVSPFVAGEVITQQDNLAHWLYILVSGEVEIYRHEENRRVELGRFTPVTLIGEMGLMTGEPRMATVAAVTHVECYRLDKNSFEDILRDRPVLAEEISQIMSQRRQAMVQAGKEAADEASLLLSSQQQGEILSRIRRFFGLG